MIDPVPNLSRALLFAIPISLVLWAALIMAVLAVT